MSVRDGGDGSPSRRKFLGVVAGAAAGLALAGCRGITWEDFAKRHLH